MHKQIREVFVLGAIHAEQRDWLVRTWNVIICKITDKILIPSLKNFWCFLYFCLWFSKINFCWSIVALQCWWIPAFLMLEVPASIVVVLSCSVMSDSLWPHGLQRPGSSVHGDYFREEYWSGLQCPPSGDLPNPEDRTQVFCITGRLFTIWATREAQEYWSE